MEERVERQGGVRLVLTGELDLLTAQRLEARLRRLWRSATPVVVDLSGLDFCDCAGLGALVRARVLAIADGWDCSVDPDCGTAVRYLLDHTTAGRYLWPAGVAVPG